jgi:hypothetical protein
MNYALKMTLTPGNKDCQIVFVALVSSGLIAMFIHEMTVDECSGALKKARLGRREKILNH